MFWNVLDEPRRLLLKKLVASPPLPGCYLAGGTALALLCGHRNSEDFDWFTAAEFVPSELAAALAAKVGPVVVVSTSPGTFHGHMDGIRVTWLHYPNPSIEPNVRAQDMDRFELASLVDIGLMKWAALSDRGARKDFIDLYELAGLGISPRALYPLLQKKFPHRSLNGYHLVKSLSFFDDAESDPWPKMFHAVDWSMLKHFFLEEQAFLMRHILNL